MLHRVRLAVSEPVSGLVEDLRRLGVAGHISWRVQEFQRRGEPVISVDAKKKEWIGQYRNGGRAEDRVRAHIFLCLLAYYVEWHMRQAPLLFQKEGLEAWQARRDPVAQAKPTPAAQAKKNRRVTADRLDLHSFSTLMQALATRCHHQCCLRDDPEEPTVERLTEPTPLQNRALELVRTFPVDDKSNY